MIGNLNSRYFFWKADQLDIFHTSNWTGNPASKLPAWGLEQFRRKISLPSQRTWRCRYRSGALTPNCVFHYSCPPYSCNLAPFTCPPSYTTIPFICSSSTTTPFTCSSYRTIRFTCSSYTTIPFTLFLLHHHPFHLFLLRHHPFRLFLLHHHPYTYIIHPSSNTDPLHLFFLHHHNSPVSLKSPVTHLFLLQLYLLFCLHQLPFKCSSYTCTLPKFNCSSYTSAPITRTIHFCPLYLNTISWPSAFNAMKDDCISKHRRLHSCIDSITRRMVHINQYPCKNSLWLGYREYTWRGLAKGLSTLCYANSQKIEEL